MKINAKIEDIENLPKYQTNHSAGMDLCSNEDVIITPGEIKIISTGLFLEIPEGFEVQIRSRSGLACKGIVVANSPGTIDSDYRGEIKVILINLSKIDFEVKKTMRIAQMVCSSYVKMELELAENLNETERAENGFGSTGV